MGLCLYILCGSISWVKCNSEVINFKAQRLLLLCCLLNVCLFPIRQQKPGSNCCTVATQDPTMPLSNSGQTGALRTFSFTRLQCKDTFLLINSGGLQLALQWTNSGDLNGVQDRCLNGQSANDCWIGLVFRSRLELHTKVLYYNGRPYHLTWKLDCFKYKHNFMLIKWSWLNDGLCGSPLFKWQSE